MKVKFLLSALLVLSLVGGSSAQLSGAYTIDPAGSGSRNYKTLIMASAMLLGHGVGGPVVFTVASTTFKEEMRVWSATGMSATNTVTFVAVGSPAIIDATGLPNGLTVNGACRYYVFENLEVKGFSSYGLNMTGPSNSRATFCTFRKCKFDAPATSSSSVRAAHLYYSDDCTFEDCVFAGGGRQWYTQQINRCVIRRCEFDGKGMSSQMLSLWNSNDSDNLYENCFMHDIGPTGYAIMANYSQHGMMFWHNTIIVKTSQVAFYDGSCCAWSRANSFRNNIVINTGTGGCIRYGHSNGLLDYNDADYNCYWAPSGLVCELENGSTFTKGTLAAWKTFYNANRATLVRPGGPTPAQAVMDDNSIEMDPSLVSSVSPYDIHLKSSSPCLDAGTTKYVAGTWISYNQTYKVLDDFEGEARPATLVDIGADEAMSNILTLSGSGKINTAVNLSLDAGTGEAGLTYQLGSAFADTPPIPIDTRVLNLSMDPLLFISVTSLAPTIFANYGGFLDANGKATAALNIPNIPALDQIRIYTAFVTIKVGEPSNIKSISNTVMFTILK